MTTKDDSSGISKTMSLFEEMKMLGRKTKRGAVKVTQEKADALTKLANKLFSEGKTSPDEIKDELAKQENSGLKGDQNILKAILTCKFQEEKIVFKDSTFSKPLNLYLSLSNVETKYLTNDHLYMQMLMHKAIDSSNAMSDEFKDLLNYSFLNSITIASENFAMDAETSKGFIQDYESEFSLISNMDTVYNQETIKQLANSKPNSGSFLYDGSNYVYYGTPDICIIQKEDASTEAVLDYANKIKFLTNDGSEFSLGEKKVTADGKVKFMYKRLLPEKFCPSYWIAPKVVKCTMLFEFQLDYNELFNYLETKAIAEGRMSWPTNVCYWDNINVFFEFLSVFLLTSRIPQALKDHLQEFITNFKGVKLFITRWKSQAMNMQRVFLDFLNSFLNNSEFKRFSNLHAKALVCIAGLKELMKKPEYGVMVGFFSSGKFASSCKRQLDNGDLIPLLEKIAKALKNYCEGTNLNGLLGDIKDIATKIYTFLPTHLGEEYLFPFIAAKGGLAGNLVATNENNLIVKNVKKVAEKKTKEKKKVKDAGALLSRALAIGQKEIKQFISDIVVKDTEGLSYKLQDDLIDLLWKYYLGGDMGVALTDITTYLASNNDKKIYPKKQVQHIKDCAKYFVDVIVNKVKRKEKFESSLWANMVERYGLSGPTPPKNDYTDMSSIRLKEESKKRKRSPSSSSSEEEKELKEDEDTRSIKSADVVASAVTRRRQARETPRPRRRKRLVRGAGVDGPGRYNLRNRPGHEG